MAYLRSAWDHAKLSPDDYSEVWMSVHRDLIYLPSRQRYERAASATNVDRIDSLKVGPGKASEDGQSSGGFPTFLNLSGKPAYQLSRSAR